MYFPGDVTMYGKYYYIITHADNINRVYKGKKILKLTGQSINGRSEDRIDPKVLVNKQYLSSFINNTEKIVDTLLQYISKSYARK